MNLLTVANAKLLKSKDYGFLSVGLHLLPHNLSGYNTCKFATKYCKISCLNLSGLSGLSNVQKSRLKKTKYLFEDTHNFLLELDAELYYYKRIAASKGLKLSARLNMTSDLDWSEYLINGKCLYAIHNDIQFIEYSKDYSRISNFPNLHITYSYDQINHKRALEVLKRGDNLAVVFDKIPKSMLGYEVGFGDNNDLRHLDKKNTIIGLKYKNIIQKGYSNKSGVVESTLVVKQDQSLNKIKKLDLVY